MKICFITTTIGIENEPYEIPYEFKSTFGNYDFFLFTNMKNVKSDVWNVIYLDNDFLDKQTNIDYKETDLKKIKINNIYKSRYIKFMGWKYIKDIMKKDYDVIFYCDANHYPNKVSNWKSIATEIVNCESGILQHMHLKKYNPLVECDKAVQYKRDTKYNMNKMKEFLLKEKIKLYPITENTVFGYNPNNSKIINAFTGFWNVYISKKITFRDQSLWELIKQKHNIKPIIKKMHRPIYDDDLLFIMSKVWKNVKKNYTDNFK